MNFTIVHTGGKSSLPLIAQMQFTRLPVNYSMSYWKGEPVRHLGVRVSELCRNDFYQMALFEKDYGKQQAVDRAVDSIREKYGNGSVFRSAFIGSGVHFSSGGTMDDKEYPMMSSLL